MHLLALAVRDTSNAVSFADRDGRWSCIPAERLAPQIEIDFIEQENSRCDQNICSVDDLTEGAARITIADGRIAIAFAPDARFDAAMDGSDCTEALRRGTRYFFSTGVCDGHSDAPDFSSKN